MIFNDSNVFGADISLYQDNNETLQQIDFTKMTGQGATFVIIRAGQNAWIDPDFAYNWSNAKAAGLPRGSYWYYDSRYDPIKQADLFASCFVADKAELELWVDLEEAYGGSYAGWQNWKKFIERLRLMIPTAKIGIYTGYYYITGKIPASEYSYFGQFPLWIAWYITNPAAVAIPAPWTSCLYWQWGTPSWGIAWGCESIEIDMDKYNGTLDQFKMRYNLGGTSPMTDRYTGYIDPAKSTSLNLRNEPNTTTSIKLGAYPANTVLTGDVIVHDTDTTTTRKWLHVTSLNNAAVSGYMAYAYLVVTDNGEPPVDELPSPLWIGASPETVREYRKV